MHDDLEKQLGRMVAIHPFLSLCVYWIKFSFFWFSFSHFVASRIRRVFYSRRSPWKLASYEGIFMEYDGVSCSLRLLVVFEWIDKNVKYRLKRIMKVCSIFFTILFLSIILEIFDLIILLYFAREKWKEFFLFSFA